MGLQGKIKYLNLVLRTSKINDFRNVPEVLYKVHGNSARSKVFKVRGAKYQYYMFFGKFRKSTIFEVRRTKFEYFIFS